MLQILNTRSITIRDRPFNIQGGGLENFSATNILFSPVRETNNFFSSSTKDKQFFFRGLWGRESSQKCWWPGGGGLELATNFFCLDRKQTIFFHKVRRQTIYFHKFRRQTIYFQNSLDPPLNIKWSVPYWVNNMLKYTSDIFLSFFLSIVG